VIGDPDPIGDVCSNPTRNQVTMGSKNIGDLLSAAGVTWGSFMGGFNLSVVNPNGTTGCHRSSVNVVDGVATADYIPHHSFFNYYTSTSNPNHTPPASIAEIGNAGPANHQYDLQDFFTAAAAGNLPAVSFLKAQAFQDGHAGYSDPLDEQTFLVNTINFLETLPTWSSTAVVIMYDDSDGWYDHQIGPIVNTSTGTADALTGPGACGTAATARQPSKRACSGPLRLRSKTAFADRLPMGAAELRGPQRHRPDFDYPVRRRQLGVRSIRRDAACRVSRRHNRLYQEGDKTRDHERNSPDQVEVEPCLTEKREAQLSIDHPSEQPSDRKISNSVDPSGENPGEWAGGRSHVVVGHLPLCFDRIAAQQNRHDHQARAVGRRRKKRPDGQISKANLHADPTRVLMPHQGIDSKPNQDRGHGIADGCERQRHTEHRGSQHHAADGQSVADRNGDERPRYCASLLLLHPQRHREEPPHPRIYSVVGAEEQHHPQRRRSQPRMRHFVSE
jgi:hypothetical protein